MNTLTGLDDLEIDLRDLRIVSSSTFLQDYGESWLEFQNTHEYLELDVEEKEHAHDLIYTQHYIAALIHYTRVYILCIYALCYSNSIDLDNIDKVVKKITSTYPYAEVIIRTFNTKRFIKDFSKYYSKNVLLFECVMNMIESISYWESWVFKATSKSRGVLITMSDRSITEEFDQILEEVKNTTSTIK